MGFVISKRNYVLWVSIRFNRRVKEGRLGLITHLLSFIQSGISLRTLTYEAGLIYSHRKASLSVICWLLQRAAILLNALINPARTLSPGGRVGSGTRGGIIIDGVGFPALHRVPAVFSREGFASLSCLRRGTTYFVFKNKKRSHKLFFFWHRLSWKSDSEMTRLETHDRCHQGSRSFTLLLFAEHFSIHSSFLQRSCQSKFLTSSRDLVLFVVVPEGATYTWYQVTACVKFTQAVTFTCKHLGKWYIHHGLVLHKLCKLLNLML